MNAHTFGVVAALLALCGCATTDPQSQSARSLGWQLPLGHGTVASYVETDGAGVPAAIGVLFSATALDGLSMDSDMHRCHGRTHEGHVDAKTQCVHMQEHVIPLPDSVARRADVPFKWVLLNWNPRGHIPPGVYDIPHFDIHFQMAPIADVFAIESGPCGPERVRCDQFAIAKKPLPANYMHVDFKDVDAVVPAMGNHLIDVTGPEFNRQPFTRSWIYGVYDGKVIFYEQMVSRAYMLGNPQGCEPIKSPQAVAVSGFYPTVSCVRRDAKSGEVTVSMERFVHRGTSPPEPPAAK